MKIGILADSHLGYERFFEDSFKQAEQALEMACDKADALILAGDIFDVKVPKPEVLAMAFKLFGKVVQRLKAKKDKVKLIQDGEVVDRVPIIAIHGTHERRTKELINPIQVMESAGILLNAHLKLIILEKNGERVAVQGLGGVPDEYAKTALEVKDFKPIPSAFNIFLLHQTLSEFLPISDKLLGIEELPKGFDLYVCGHIHSKRVESLGNKLLIVPGSTVMTQMKKEEREEKGFFIFDTETKKYSFVKINTRPFVFKELVFEKASIKEVSEKVRNTISAILLSKEKPLIKIKLLGTLADGIEASNLHFTLSEFEGKAFIEIDKSFEAISFEEKMEKWRKGMEKRVSIKEMGIKILCEKLRDANFKLDDPEGLFNLISENPEEALKKVLSS